MKQKFRDIFFKDLYQTDPFNHTVTIDSLWRYMIIVMSKYRIRPNRRPGRLRKFVLYH